MRKENDHTYQMEWSEGKYPDFNEEYFEWIDLIEAVLNSSQRLTIMELGAGYGRWSVNAALAATILGKDYRIIAVEPEPQHFKWLQENIDDNGLDKNRCRLVEAAISTSEGESKFYAGDPAGWYGQRIIFESDPPIGQEDLNRGVYIVPVKSIALSSLLNGEGLIDLIDMDIQGSELEVIKSAKKEISSQVKKVHVATHSHEIEEGLRNFFHELSWAPTYDYGYQGKHMTEYGEINFIDGVQGWINPKFSSDSKITNEKNSGNKKISHSEKTNPNISSKLSFSIVLPVKSEYHLLQKSLVACYAMNPDEVIICMDDPPDKKTLQEINRIADNQGCSDKTKIITVPKNPQFSFHQAWVRREGFRQAKHDRILTVDADTVVNKNVLKALSMIGKDNVGFVSYSTLHTKNGLVNLWRHLAFRVTNKISTPKFTGLYALWKPYWLDSEDENIKSLQNARKAKGGFALIGEDAYLHNCMQKKYKCIHISDYGGYCLRNDCNDLPHVQFETGRFYAKKFKTIQVLLRSILFLRPQVLKGYFYQKRTDDPLPSVDPDKYPFEN